MAVFEERVLGPNPTDGTETVKAKLQPVARSRQKRRRKATGEAKNLRKYCRISRTDAFNAHSQRRSLRST